MLFFRFPGSVVVVVAVYFPPAAAKRAATSFQLAILNIFIFLVYEINLFRIMKFLALHAFDMQKKYK